MALASDTPRDSKSISKSAKFVLKASTTIYAGALVITDADGLLTPLVPGELVQFAGVALETVSSGATGTTYCQVARNGKFLLPATDMAQANIGDVVYGLDDATILLAGDLDEESESYCPKLGVITELVSATAVWVDIDDGVARPEVSALIEPEEP